MKVKCKGCIQAQNAFVLLNRVMDVTDLGVICFKCEKIWCLSDTKKLCESVKERKQ